MTNNALNNAKIWTSKDLSQGRPVIIGTKRSDLKVNIHRVKAQRPQLIIKFWIQTPLLLNLSDHCNASARQIFEFLAPSSQPFPVFLQSLGEFAHP
jgi:hypothetical protein